MKRRLLSNSAKKKPRTFVSKNVPYKTFWTFWCYTRSQEQQKIIYYIQKACSKPNRQQFDRQQFDHGWTKQVVEISIKDIKLWLWEKLVSHCFALWVMMGSKLNVFTVLYVQKICLILISVSCGRNVHEKCYCAEVYHLSAYLNLLMRTHTVCKRMTFLSTFWVKTRINLCLLIIDKKNPSNSKTNWCQVLSYIAEITITSKKLKLAAIASSRRPLWTLLCIYIFDSPI